MGAIKSERRAVSDRNRWAPYVRNRTLAAAHYSSSAAQGRGPSAARAPTDTSVDVLINILREMERKQLIPPGLVPK